MKTKTRTIAFVLFSLAILQVMCFASLFGADAANEPKADPSGAYLKHTVDVKREDGERLAYNLLDFKKIDYVIQEGDMLEYDVTISLDEAGWGHIDGIVTGGQGGTLRDAPGMEDQNGIPMHCGRDISEYAYENWYHRIINLALPDINVGATITYIQLACHPENDEIEEHCVILYDNIVITNNGEVKLVIFKDEADWPENTAFACNTTRFTTVALEMLVFTDEEIAAFKAAEEAARLEEESRVASRAEAEASKEASREQASIDASLAQEAAAQTTAGDTAAEDSSSDENGANTGLIIALVAGGVVVVVVIILIIVGSGKKKGEKK
ncbi:MAG: hypothetical protein FWG34_03385 [Oscillospiraceae bacterium]|nr:hypothetical protein [Oscillospiraceae bacterium]